MSAKRGRAPLSSALWAPPPALWLYSYNPASALLCTQYSATRKLRNSPLRYY